MLIVAQILERKGPALHTVDAGASLHEAATVMAQRGTGSLAVRSRGELVGMLSERDIVLRMADVEGAVYDTPVGEAMHPVVTVAPEDDLRHCMGLMTDRRIRHLLVLDHGRPAGVISIGDVVKALIDEQEGTITSLHHYISGAPD